MCRVYVEIEKFQQLGNKLQELMHRDVMLHVGVRYDTRMTGARIPYLWAEFIDDYEYDNIPYYLHITHR